MTSSRLNTIPLSSIGTINDLRSRCILALKPLALSTAKLEGKRSLPERFRTVFSTCFVKHAETAEQLEP